jgi:hypothetical protein
MEFNERKISIKISLFILDESDIFYLSVLTESVHNLHKILEYSILQ